ITSFPSLDNEGDLIKIISPDGRLIHAVKYSDAWYKNDLKKGGGWSLEMIDTKKPWATAYNWVASNDKRGGTPGEKNSVANSIKDLDFPQLVKAFVTDSNHIVLSFNEALDSLSAIDFKNYVVNDQDLKIFSVLEVNPLFDQVNLNFSGKMQPGKIYSITVVGLSDCNGNKMSFPQELRVGLSEIADSNDIIINEILFHPKTGGKDYIELFNRSRKLVNLNELFLSNRNSDGAINPPLKISQDAVLFFPGDYLLLTENIERTSMDYLIKNPKSVIEMKSLPTFPNDEGHAVVLNFQGAIIDELHYKENWHFPLITENAGISLERIDPEKNTQEKSNWHSAASDAGFGTPSYENSQAIRPTAILGAISLSTETISPDNDGYNDFVSINYQFEKPGNVCNISIFDFEGRCIRHIARNGLCGTNGYYIWDGLDDKNQKSGIGVYILFAEFFDLNGRVQKIRRPIVVAAKF
ncbi:MAG: hypothetical protein C5B52_07985, partial [Bacteroidetes bacterium]